MVWLFIYSSDELDPLTLQLQLDSIIILSSVCLKWSTFNWKVSYVGLNNDWYGAPKRLGKIDWKDVSALLNEKRENINSLGIHAIRKITPYVPSNVPSIQIDDESYLVTGMDDTHKFIDFMIQNCSNLTKLRIGSTTFSNDVFQSEEIAKFTDEFKRLIQKNSQLESFEMSHVNSSSHIADLAKLGPLPESLRHLSLNVHNCQKCNEDVCRVITWHQVNHDNHHNLITFFYCISVSMGQAPAQIVSIQQYPCYWQCFGVYWAPLCQIRRVGTILDGNVGSTNSQWIEKYCLVEILEKAQFTKFMAKLGQCIYWNESKLPWFENFGFEKWVRISFYIVKYTHCYLFVQEYIFPMRDYAQFCTIQNSTTYFLMMGTKSVTNLACADRIWNIWR